MTTDRIVCVLCGRDGHRSNACPLQSAASPRTMRHDGIRTLDDIKGRCVIDDETGCWLWRSAMSHSNTRKIAPTPRVWLPPDLTHIDGAGRVTTAGKAAWLLAGKPLLYGHIVWRQACHRNDCINPEHGKDGTRQAMHKAIAKSGRLKGDPQRAIVNARNRERMLVPLDVVRQAEAMFEAGRLQKDVQSDLGLVHSTVQLIRRGMHPHSSGRQRTVRGASVFNLGG